MKKEREDQEEEEEEEREEEEEEKDKRGKRCTYKSSVIITPPAAHPLTSRCDQVRPRKEPPNEDLMSSMSYVRRSTMRLWKWFMMRDAHDEMRCEKGCGL